MNDAATTLADIKEATLAFTRERNWEQFHHPKDLGLALAIEVGELLEHFRYLDNVQIAERLREPKQQREFAHELADCLFLLARLAGVCSIDLAAAFEEKVALAAQKYPIETVSGKPFKYSHYATPAPADKPP